MNDRKPFEPQVSSKLSGRGYQRRLNFDADHCRAGEQSDQQANPPDAEAHVDEHVRGIDGGFIHRGDDRVHRTRQVGRAAPWQLRSISDVPLQSQDSIYPHITIEWRHTHQSRAKSRRAELPC